MNTVTIEKSDKPALDRLRACARRKGLRIEKSRQQIHINNRGGLQLISGNTVIAGVDYDLDLADADNFLKNID